MVVARFLRRDDFDPSGMRATSTSLGAVGSGDGDILELVVSSSPEQVEHDSIEAELFQLQNCNFLLQLTTSRCLLNKYLPEVTDWDLLLGLGYNRKDTVIEPCIRSKEIHNECHVPVKRRIQYVVAQYLWLYWNSNYFFTGFWYNKWRQGYCMDWNVFVRQ